MAPSDIAYAFPDLQHPLFRASHGLIHDRFCTNAPTGLDKARVAVCCCCPMTHQRTASQIIKNVIVVASTGAAARCVDG